MTGAFFAWECQKYSEHKFCVVGIFIGHMICYYTLNREGETADI